MYYIPSTCTIVQVLVTDKCFVLYKCYVVYCVVYWSSSYYFLCFHLFFLSQFLSAVPAVDFQCSGSELQFMMCIDSCLVFRDLLIYLAESKDTPIQEPSLHYTISTSDHPIAQGKVCLYIPSNMYYFCTVYVLYYFL